MARLFITQREQSLISDWTKEVTKDVIGQRIFYYPISERKSAKGDLYDESSKKAFENPIEIDARVGNPTNAIEQTEFGPETTTTLEAYVHYRDAIDKGFEIVVGDFFTYGKNTYEISSAVLLRTIYGQVEYSDGWKISGVKARKSTLKVAIKGPTDIKDESVDPEAVQKTFVQQRGMPTNTNGETNDKREMIENGNFSQPIEGQRSVKESGKPAGNSFYGEDLWLTKRKMFQ